MNQVIKCIDSVFYYGIELSEAKGKSDGAVSGIKYFKCKQKRGLFYDMHVFKPLQILID